MLAGMRSELDKIAELDKVVSALSVFYARETFLLDKDVGERALTHRLAVYLEGPFGGWDIDCDYNRLGERRLLLPKGTIISTDDDIGKSVYPDIVVHRRTVPENLLAIEIRKAANFSALEHDRHKLRALTDPHLWFAYRIGLLLVLGRKRVSLAEVFVGGVFERPLSDWLTERLNRSRPELE
jgi:hypothetical protein